MLYVILKKPIQITSRDASIDFRELNKYGIDFPYLFNEIIKNIFSDFIPHETITFDDRDLP